MITSGLVKGLVVDDLVQHHLYVTPTTSGAKMREVMPED